MFNYIIYRVGQFIALSLPLKLSYRVAVAISDLHYLFAFADKRAVRDNLRVIFPQKSEKELRRIRKGMFRNFAKYLVDFFRFPKMDAEYIRKNIKVENTRYFDEALAKGKGVIVLSAHLGNWELGGVAVAQLGYPLWVVALTHKDKRVNDFFNFQRESKGIVVIPLGIAVRRCLGILRENKMVALVADRDFNEGGVPIDFFGRQALLPAGPAVFHLKTGASIVPGFMFRNPDDTFTLQIGKPVEFTPTGDKDKDVAALMAKYKLLLEDYITRYPDQWYMFRRFWVS